MSSTIILAGGFSLPDRNASATRAIGMAKLYQSLGYQVILVGKTSSTPPPLDKAAERVIEGVRCLDIRRPFPGRDYRPYDRSAETVVAVIDSLPAGSVLAVSAYNHPVRGAWSIIRACKRRQIPVILDCTEWHGWEGHKIVRNLFRMVMTSIRLRVLTRIAGNVICTSRWLARAVGGANIQVLPWVVDASMSKWRVEPARIANPDGPRRFVYSGSPGLGMKKDLLFLAIAGFAELFARGCPFEFNIAGLTLEEYLSIRPADAVMLERMQQEVHFLGRIPHEESLALLRSADFSVFFRRRNRVSNAGFPSKFVEACALGIPSITNATSDLPLYLTDGINGFMAPRLTKHDIAATLERAARLTDGELLAMKHARSEVNPFDIPKWLVETGAFLDRLRLPR